VQAGELLNPRDQFYYANELSDHKLWERAVAQYERFLAEGKGWIEDNIMACGRLSDCYFNMGRIREAKAKALEAFSFALPRAEACCRIGWLHMSEHNYQDAVWWYKLASQLEMPKNTNAILQHACWTWLPHLQLCVCYDRLEQYELANEHNELAAGYIPNDSKVVDNRNYFAKRASGSLS
jgi:tetratricopeptide (TPR) repeat protein